MPSGDCEPISPDVLGLLRDAFDLLQLPWWRIFSRNRRRRNAEVAAKIGSLLVRIGPARHPAMVTRPTHRASSRDSAAEDDQIQLREATGGFWVREWLPITDVALARYPPELRYRAIVAGLPEETREVFLLHRCGGLTYSQIAYLRELSKEQVEVHIAEALVLIGRALPK